MRVEISGPAAADLEDIADWIASDNQERADSFVAELIEKGLSLSDHPMRFPAVGRWDGELVRKLSWRGYVILYYVGNSRVEIVRIVQASRDWGKLLPEG